MRRRDVKYEEEEEEKKGKEEELIGEGNRRREGAEGDGRERGLKEGENEVESGTSFDSFQHISEWVISKMENLPKNLNFVNFPQKRLNIPLKITDDLFLVIRHKFTIILANCRKFSCFFI